MLNYIIADPEGHAYIRPSKTNLDLMHPFCPIAILGPERSQRSRIIRESAILPLKQAETHPVNIAVLDIRILESLILKQTDV